MGTTSAKVSNKFEVLTTFLYSHPTRKDIKRLDRRVNKALCRIKCLNLRKDRIKMLLEDGITSSELIEWGNEIIDSTINSDNMERYVKFAPLIKLAANSVKYLRPLPVLWKRYLCALRTDPLSAIKYVRQSAIIFVFLYIHTAIINRTPVENSDIEIAEKYFVPGPGVYLNRFFPFVTTDLSNTHNPYNVATSKKTNVDIHPGASIISSYGTINRKDTDSSTRIDITAIGQYETFVFGGNGVYLPESIYYKEFLNCYYNPNTGVIRYLKEKFGDFKPITQHPSVGTRQPWPPLINTYPLSRKDDAGTLSTPFSYIDLSMLKDAYDLMDEATVIHLPLTPTGFRIAYENNVTKNRIDFYSADLDGKNLITKNSIGVLTPIEDIKLEGFTAKVVLYTSNDSGGIIPGIQSMSELSNEGLTKVYISPVHNDLNAMRRAITIGGYAYLVLGDNYNKDKDVTVRQPLTDLYKKLVKYQHEVQY